MIFNCIGVRDDVVRMTAEADGDVAADGHLIAAEHPIVDDSRDLDPPAVRHLDLHADRQVKQPSR